MLISFSATPLANTRKWMFVLVTAGIVMLAQPLQSEAGSQATTASRGPELTLLVDINPDQDKIFGVQRALAERVVVDLGKSGYSFSLVTFGSDQVRQPSTGLEMDEALTAIRNLRPEPATSYSGSPKLYEALIKAMGLQPDANRAILVISGGREDLNGKRFKMLLEWVRVNQTVCHVALVSWHPLYGTKGIQFRGFYLHDLSRKTHGQYVELGKNESKVPRAVEKLFQRIRLQEQARAH